MLLNDAVALAKKDTVDVVLAVVGLDERSESEGLDRSTMAIPQAQNDLVTALAKTGKPVVIVLVAGSPVELPWFNDVAAMLYVGLSGQAGASATVRALTGEVNPSGHLAETWPMQYEDCPSSGWYPAIGRDAIYREGPFVGYRYYETVGVSVRFPFGYGLSYSTFTYSAITATATGVDFVVTNDSDVAGSTVAQLYVRAPQGGVLHPDRELKGFAKIELAAHESKSVHIDFDRYTFRHFDVAANAWKTESGEWTLMIGDNAEHLPLSIPHTVAGDCTPAECAADPALGHYLTGQVKDVTDAEMAVLFGHEVLAPGKPTTFGVNDPIMSWVDSRGFAARTCRQDADQARSEDPPEDRFAGSEHPVHPEYAASRHEQDDPRHGRLGDGRRHREHRQRAYFPRIGRRDRRLLPQPIRQQAHRKGAEP